MATVDERLREAHGVLVGRLDVVATLVRQDDPGAHRSWATFASGLRDWLASERESLLPLIDTRLHGCTDRGRLRVEHGQLERLLVRAGEQVERRDADSFADTAHELLLLLYRHSVRERRRFAAQLDLILTGDERQRLLERLRAPVFVPGH